MEELFSKMGEIRVIICILALNFVLIPNSIFAQDNTNETVTKLADNALNRNETSIFAFYFKESGGLVPVNNYVLFDNLSKELVHVNLVNESISKNVLKEGETKNLRDAILIAQFFDLKPVYKGEGADI